MEYHTANLQNSAHHLSSPASNPDQIPFFPGSLRELARSLGAELETLGDDLPSPASSCGVCGEVHASSGSRSVDLTPVSNTGVNPTLKEANGANSTVCIDTLTFSFPGHHFDGSIKAVGKWLRRWTCGVLSVGGELEKRFNGYPKCYALVLADGGPAPNLGWLGVSAVSDNMRGRWCIHLTGVACSCLSSASKPLPDQVAVSWDASGCSESREVPGGSVTPWECLAADADPYGVRITRIDLAADDLLGEHSVQSARDSYSAGVFSANGRPPSFKYIETSKGDGCTFYVGKACSGKMLRVYEKGKQLGCPGSLWVRWEVQLLSINRHLPPAMLLDPRSYMRGSYPRALGWIGGAASLIVTKVLRGRLLLERALKYARQQVGSLICYLRVVKGMEDQAIVGDLVGRPGRHPMRLFEYELPDDPWLAAERVDDVWAVAERLGLAI